MTTSRTRWVFGFRLDRKAKDPQSDFVAQPPEEQTCDDA